MIDSGSVKWTWRWFSPFPDLVFLSATFNTLRDSQVIGVILLKLFGVSEHCEKKIQRKATSFRNPTPQLSHRFKTFLPCPDLCSFGN